MLVACSPGIESATERALRRESDGRLIDQLLGEPYEAFIERWRTQPLFAADPPQVSELARADQRRNDPRALAEVLRGVGAGAMEPLWDRLGDLAMPVAVVVGERDEKFVGIARRMMAAVPDAEMHTIPGGHGLPLESPAALAAVLATDPRTARSATAS